MGASASVNEAVAAAKTDGERETLLIEQLKATAPGLDADQQISIARQLVWAFKSASAAGKSPAETAEAMRARGDALVATATLPSFACPKVRFGKTELQMPIVTCGGMRMQQSWGGAVQSMDQVSPECQENFVAIVKRALALGINHFETARGYGCSELQYGAALRAVLDEGCCARDAMIVQTKVAASADPERFRATMETSMGHLLPAVGHIDLFAFHGINRDDQLEWITRPGGCMDVAREYQKAGKLRHIGFSTHGQTPTIVRAIETGLFDYVNLHYHWLGSYTASGCKPEGGNVAAVAAARAQDMGVFCISPVDKGGHLYDPSAKLAALCAPELSPIEYSLLWGWSAARGGHHTQVIGAARPSDFDEAVSAARLHGTPDGEARLGSVEKRLAAVAEDALGADWVAGWWKGVPNCWENAKGVHATNMVFYHNVITAFGLYSYARERYNNNLGNRRKWVDDASWDENMAKQDWGFGPGCALHAAGGAALLEEGALKDCADPEKVARILDEVHGWLTAPPDPLPEGWESAFDARPWPAFCERGKNAAPVTRAAYLDRAKAIAP